jgi:N-formylglutamate amidohydrolase
MILHIPHASTFIPDEIRKDILLDDSELATELLRMTDRYTDELFAVDAPFITRIVYPVSRLVADPERFANEDQEPMSRKGMGVIYALASHGKQLRHPVTPEQKERLLAQYYRPHHEKFSTAVEQELLRKGSALIIDCHSFPSKPLPYEKYQSADRPDICIGADKYHTPEALLKTVHDFFGQSGYTVAVNRPFAGTIVPMSFYKKSQSVMSIMIELNRGLYMDEATGQKHRNYEVIEKSITALLQGMVQGEA